MAPGGRLVVARHDGDAGEDHAEDAVVKQVGRRRRQVADSRSTASLSTSYERGSVIVHGNVALATHGETVQQLLGSGPGELEPSSASRSRTTRSPTCSRAPTRRAPRRHARGARQRRALGRGADAVRRRRRATAPTPSAPTRPARPTCSSATATHGARLPTGVEQRAGDLPQGPRRGRQRRARARSPSCSTGRSASRACSNPSAAERRRRPGDGGVGARLDPARRAHARSRGLAARLRGLRAGVQPASSKADAAVLPLRAGRTIVVTVAFEGGEPRLDDLDDGAADHGDPHVEVLVLAGTSQTLPARAARSPSIRPTTPTPSSPASRRRSARPTPSTRATSSSRSTAPRSIAVAHGVAGRARRRRRPALHGRRRPGSRTGCSPSTPGVGAGRRRDRGRRCSCSDVAPLDWLEEMT